ncbi:MAG TPA: tetratricopeptide repeat protein [Stellaceae bacterium]|nr:tetratricopeptide repeat protein [Stellaceae bacterium]
MTEYPLISSNELAAQAWAAMERRDADEALRLWQALREHSPQRPEGHIWPIQVLWESGRFDEAEALAEAAFAHFPDDVELLVQHAWIASARQQWPEALHRWTKVCKIAPERLDGRVRMIQALRMVGRHDESEKMANATLERYPNDTELVIEHIWAAIARNDWKAAAARYDRACADTRHQPRLGESLGPMEARMRQLAAAAGDGMVTAPPPAAAPAPRDDAMAALMLGFESMGERCDFGAVQRYFGGEPLGLLRFAWSRLDPLVAALDDRFGAVGQLEDTVFDLYGDETILWMRKYNLLFHTFVYGVDKQPQDKRDAFHQQQRRRLLFLRDKLIGDLEEPQKILVYSTDDYGSDAEAAKLFAAVRAYGPNTLLFVRPEQNDRPAGTVEMLEDGLYAGYFTGLTDFVVGNQPPFELWRELCLKTRALADARRG